MKAYVYRTTERYSNGTYIVPENLDPKELGVKIDPEKGVGPFEISADMMVLLDAITLCGRRNIGFKPNENIYWDNVWIE